MKIQVLSLAATVAGMLGVAAAEACDPPVRVVRKTGVVLVQPCAADVVEVQTLLRLQQPVHIRVVRCSDELAAAKAALAGAIAARDAAVAAETVAIDRVEAAACLLKTMSRCIEINGCVYTKDDIAAAVEVLISRYHSAKGTLAVAGELVEQRTAELTQVEARVVKWQRKEQELLSQVASLRSAREASAASVQKAAAAALASELTGMLEKAPTNVVIGVATSATETTIETTTELQPETAGPAGPDALLHEVDQILQEKSGG